MKKRIGVLSAGSDSPGLNAVIRGIGKAAQRIPGFEAIGFQDGFHGLLKEQFVPLKGDRLSGILTLGGTILGTSRDQPDQMEIDGKMIDQTNAIVESYQKHQLHCLVCLGGCSAQQSALMLAKKGLNVVTLPVIIDNDLPMTDTTIGFDTAMSIAADAIDHLHNTAHSHHRIIVVEIMGRQTGWLTLGSGVAGGADVILIPEMPYDETKIADAILRRSQRGRPFSIVAVSEGAISKENMLFFEQARQINTMLRQGEEQSKVASQLAYIENQSAGNTIHLANQLNQFTGLETRITILGYLQCGGVPTAADRLLATQLGTACISSIEKKQFGVMIAVQGGNVVAVPLEQVVNKRKTIPTDHPWIASARSVDTSLGD